MVCGFWSTSYAQSVMGAFQYGNAQFNMGQMEELMDEDLFNIFDTLRVSPQKMQTYPSYKSISGYIGYGWKKNSIVVNWSYYTTGGRIDYSDYSGILRVDRVLSTKPILVTYRRSLFNEDKPYNVLVGLGIGKTKSINTSITYFEIYISEEKENDVTIWKSSQVFMQPEIRLQWYPIRFIFLEIKAGYLIQLKSTDQEYAESKLQLPISKDMVHLNWSGLKLEAGIGIRLNLSRGNAE